MEHNIQLTVNGFSFPAHAVIAQGKQGRHVERVTCSAPPFQVLAALEGHIVGINDLLEVARHHLSDTSRSAFNFSVGPVDVSAVPLNLGAFRTDLTGRTYEVEVTDTKGGKHVFDVGASYSFYALTAVEAVIGAPLRSSAVHAM